MAASDRFRPHVLATFSTTDDARAAASAARERFPDAELVEASKDDELDALALGSRSEMHESVPAFGLFTGPFLRGAIPWAIAGAILGALLMIPLTWIVTMDGTSRWLIALLMAVIGALALSTVGFVLGAGSQAVKEGATTPEDPTAVLRVDAGPAEADELIEFFTSRSARTARYVDQPVPRRAAHDVEDPRPLPDDRDSDHSVDRQYNAGFRSDVG